MKRILITGVSRGLGNGLARQYLSKGNRVFGSCRDPRDEGVRNLADEFGERFEPLLFDVRDEDTIREAAEKTARGTDGIDILINNAGIAPEEPGTGPTEVSPDQIALAFDVNVLGPVRVLTAFYPLLRKGREPKAVMISSTAGSMGLTRGGRSIPYCVSKASLNMLTLLLHFRLKEQDIPIAAIHPGWVRTDMGGQGASIPPEESAEALMNLIDGLTVNSPVYMDYRGEELPW